MTSKQERSSPTDGSADASLSYEERRLANIAKNQAMLAQLGIPSISRNSALKSSAKRARAPAKKTKSARRKLKSEEGHDEEQQEEQRRSLRLRGVSVPAPWRTPDGDTSSSSSSSSLSSEAGDGGDSSSSSLRAHAQRIVLSEEDQINLAFFESLRDADVKSVSNSTTSSTTSSSRADYLQSLARLRLSENSVKKVVPSRIYSMALHPSNSQVIVSVGDKFGQLGIWRYCDDDDQQMIQSWRPHSKAVSGVEFCDATRLASCSYDGVIRVLDLEKEVFEVIHTATDSSVSLHSLHVDPSSGGQLLLCGDSYGTLLWCDTRCSSSSSSKSSSLASSSSSSSWSGLDLKPPQHVAQAHESKIFTIDTHPLQTHCICTASLDRTVKLWDTRKLTAAASAPGHHSAAAYPLRELDHGLCVSSARFSPPGNDGSYLVTVCNDDLIRVYDSAALLLQGEADPAPRLIPHNNKTGRWISKFQATWDPKQPDSFVVGSLQQPRQVEVYSVGARDSGVRIIAALRNVELLKSACSLNLFHHSLNVLVGANASGRVFCWKDEQLSL